MKTTPANAQAEAVPTVPLCDADKLHSRELRKAIAEYIETQREAVKARAGS
jgi:hypothetical protein